MAAEWDLLSGYIGDRRYKSHTPRGEKRLFKSTPARRLDPAGFGVNTQ